METVERRVRRRSDKTATLPVVGPPRCCRGHVSAGRPRGGGRDRVAATSPVRRHHLRVKPSHAWLLPAHTGRPQELVPGGHALQPHGTPAAPHPPCLALAGRAGDAPPALCPPRGLRKEPQCAAAAGAAAVDWPVCWPGRPLDSAAKPPRPPRRARRPVAGAAAFVVLCSGGRPPTMAVARAACVRALAASVGRSHVAVARRPLAWAGPASRPRRLVGSGFLSAATVGPHVWLLRSLSDTAR